jgi:hypothetical protein
MTHRRRPSFSPPSGMMGADRARSARGQTRPTLLGAFLIGLGFPSVGSKLTRPHHQASPPTQPEGRETRVNSDVRATIDAARARDMSVARYEAEVLGRRPTQSEMRVNAEVRAIIDGARARGMSVARYEAEVLGRKPSL